MTLKWQAPNVRENEFLNQNSIEGIMNAYFRSKQQAMQGQGQQFEQNRQTTMDTNAEKDRVAADVERQGYDSRLATPQARQMASLPLPQGPALPGQQTPSQQENPLFGLIRAHVEKKRASDAMGMRGKGADVALTEAKTANELAESEKRKAEAGNVGKVKGTKAEDDLRGELQTLSKPFVQVRDSMGRIEAAAKNPSAAGDLALIFNYMKVLDPGSTVREGEFATAQNSAGMPERIRAKYNQVVNGERLEENQRADFVDRARDLYKSQESIQKQTEGQYRRLAERRGADPANVILNQGLAKSSGGREEVPLKDASGKTRIAYYEGTKFAGWK